MNEINDTPGREERSLRAAWGMATNGMQDAAEFNPGPSVQLQLQDSSPANRGDANDAGKPFIPEEVISPKVNSRIEKRDDVPGRRVGSRRCGSLYSVTTEAGPCQICLSIWTSRRARQDVFNRKRRRGVSLLAQTIFAAISGSFGDELSNRDTNSAGINQSPARHWPLCHCPGPAHPSTARRMFSEG